MISSARNLPAGIAAVMIATITVFVLTVGLSNSWLGHVLDDQARDQSVAQIRNARDNLLAQVRLTAIDYAKWGTAVDAIEAEDLDWIYENIGAGANAGQVFHLAVIWGGRYAEDTGWADDGIEQGRPDLLDPTILGLAERRLVDLPLGTFEATEFFTWRRGALYAVSAARLEVADEGRDLQPRDEEIERLLMGRRISNEVIADIADSFLVSGLGLEREAPMDRPSVPLMGGDGQPVAFLAWDMPQPGTTMLRRIAPVLFFIVLLTAALAALGMALVRRSAQRLVLAEHQSATAARTDGLTGLANRLAFTEVLALPARAGERAVVFLDLNGFKRINDALGHEVGDGVIQAVARRLSVLVSKKRMLARIGGDEFVFVLAMRDAEVEVERLVLDLKTAMEAPVIVCGHTLRVRAAMGYAVQRRDQEDPEALVHQADLAMYEAKRRSDGRAVGFDVMIERSDQEARAIERALRSTLAGADGALAVAYQPIVHARTGRVVRAEALARWTSVELGAVPPDRFIAVAEQAGLIGEVGRLMFALICSDLQAYPDLQVSMNVSPVQLMAPTYVADLVRDLAVRGIDPSRVEVELTEGLMVDDPALASRRLAELRAAGLTVSLDDFGTGYSSIGYLRELSFDTLKIDRTFVTGLATSAELRKLCGGMVQIGQALGLTIVCEGIETAEELALVASLGCDFAQGFHIGRPVTIDEFAQRWFAPPLRLVASFVA